jgi:hypothetical protein
MLPSIEKKRLGFAQMGAKQIFNQRIVLGAKPPRGKEGWQRSRVITVAMSMTCTQHALMNPAFAQLTVWDRHARQRWLEKIIPHGVVVL